MDLSHCLVAGVSSNAARVGKCEEIIGKKQWAWYRNWKVCHLFIAVATSTVDIGLQVRIFWAQDALFCASFEPFDLANCPTLRWPKSLPYRQASRCKFNFMAPPWKKATWGYHFVLSTPLMTVSSGRPYSLALLDLLVIASCASLRSLDLQKTSRSIYPR
jgi:hypothetical protein